MMLIIELADNKDLHTHLMTLRPELVITYVYDFVSQ